MILSTSLQNAGSVQGMSRSSVANSKANSGSRSEIGIPKHISVPKLSEDLNVNSVPYWHWPNRYTLPQIKLSLVQDGSKFEDRVPIFTPRDAEVFFEPLKWAPEEHFVSLHLNSRNEVIGVHEVSHGTISSSYVHPREVFKAALLANTYAIIVAHNHPSGSRLSASEDDIKTTDQLLKAADVIGIPILDHLILSRNESAYSVRDNFPKLWEKKEKEEERKV